MSRPTETFVWKAASRSMPALQGAAASEDPAKAKKAGYGGARLPARTASSRSTTSGCAIDEFLFETGPLDNPYSAEGTGFVDLGDEAALRAYHRRCADAFRRGGRRRGKGRRPDARASGSRRCRRRWSSCRRPAIPGRIDVSLPAVVAGDTTVRDVRLSAEPAKGGWTLKSLPRRCRDAPRWKPAASSTHRRRVRIRRFAAARGRAAVRLCGMAFQGRGRRDPAAARRRIPGQGRPDGGAAEF